MPLFGPPNIEQLEAKRDTQGLIKALAYKDPKIRMAAADALAPMRDPIAVEPLIGLIDDENAGVRRAAVAALSARGGFRVVEPLVFALEDRDPDVRAAAATAVYRRLMADPDQDARRATASALGRIRAADAVEPLLKAINDADETVRLAAIRALQAIGDPAAILPLIQIQANEEVRQRTTGRPNLAVERAAGAALDALCGPTTVDELAAAVQHSDSDVREIAVRRISRIGVPAIAEPLVPILMSEDTNMRRQAARGLFEVGWRPKADEQGAIFWSTLRDWRHLAECGPTAIPMLVEAFETASAPERQAIVAGLARTNWEPSANGVADAAGDGAASADGEHPADGTTAEASDGETGARPDHERVLAASVFVARGMWDKAVEVGPAAVEPVKAAIKETPHWRDKLTAAHALAKLGGHPEAPFENPGLVTEALAVFDEPRDGPSAEADRTAAMEQFLAAHSLFKPEKDRLTLCSCGYPVIRVDGRNGMHVLGSILGVDVRGPRVKLYHCPVCDSLPPDYN